MPPQDGDRDDDVDETNDAEDPFHGFSWFFRLSTTIQSAHIMPQK